MLSATLNEAGRNESGPNVLLKPTTAHWTIAHYSLCASGILYLLPWRHPSVSWFYLRV